MNDRIKELSEQVRKSIPKGLDTDEWINLYNQKFAELIVRECADVTHSLIVEDGKEFPMTSVSYRLKQHFGVE